jgi:hypothetical protein
LVVPNEGEEKFGNVEAKSKSSSFINRDDDEREKVIPMVVVLPSSPEQDQ